MTLLEYVSDNLRFLELQYEVSKLFEIRFLIFEICGVQVSKKNRQQKSALPIILRQQQ